MPQTYAPKKKQAEDLSQLMPQNIDAEEAILGAILVNPSCMNKIVEQLRPESFYKPSHRYVYEAMLQLYNGEDKIDIVSVSDVLNINQKLELVGGRAFINDLSYKTITTTNVEYYARIDEPVHPGTIINIDGTPVAGDAGEALKKIRGGTAALTTLGGIGEALGGYKGYGFNMFVELMCAALSDGYFGKQLNGVDENGN